MQLQIALLSNRSDSRQLWLMNADGATNAN
jgi:hypothetical protein